MASTPEINTAAKKASELTDEEVAEKHRLWMAKHGKSYKDEEERERRMKIFKDTLLFIDEHNSGGHSYKVGLNQFADLTNEEYRSSYCGGLRAPEERETGKGREGESDV